MRTVTVGTASMRHPMLDEDEILPDTIDPRLEEAGPLLREAAQRGCDFMCLPELFADPTQGTQMERFAEEVGGPVTSWLSQRAKEHGMAIVTTVTLREGDRIYNTGVVYDKAGELAGRYAKVHLPSGERDAATPGDGFPVFEVDGVKVGVQICYDLNFPEGCRILAVKGAEVIFWPNMWGGMPEDFTDVIMKARAMENQVRLVSSAFVLTGPSDFRTPKLYGRSCVIDWDGTILAEVGRRLGIATATIYLAEPRDGEVPRQASRFEHRLPHLYGELAE